MKLYFVRHGETKFNKEGRLMGGRTDEPLDADGIKQSELLAKKISNYTFDKIYSSPLARALVTAEIINKNLKLQLATREELRERDFGSLSGKTWAEIQHETGKDLHPLDDALQYDYRPFGGESVTQVKARLQIFLDFAKTTHPSHALLVVTHYGLIELMSQITGQELVRAGNDSVHEFTFN